MSDLLRNLVRQYCKDINLKTTTLFYYGLVLKRLGLEKDIETYTEPWMGCSTCTADGSVVGTQPSSTVFCGLLGRSVESLELERVL